MKTYKYAILVFLLLMGLPVTVMAKEPTYLSMMMSSGSYFFKDVDNGKDVFVTSDDIKLLASTLDSMKSASAKEVKAQNSAGYSQGLKDPGKLASPSIATVTYTLHQHVGSKATCGGCYTAPYTAYYTQSAHWTDPHRHGNMYTGVPDACRSCSQCGACESDGHSLCSTTYAVTEYNLTCGKTTSTIEEVKIVLKAR